VLIKSILVLTRFSMVIILSFLCPSEKEPESFGCLDLVWHRFPETGKTRNLYEGASNLLDHATKATSF
jgi:hypothetical protein